MSDVETTRGLAPGEILRRIEDAIADPDGRGGWVRSHHPYDDLPPKDSGDLGHQTFAVGILGTEFFAEDRQRRTTGAHCMTTVGIRYLADCNADSKPESHREFLELEAELVRRVMSLNGNPDLSIRLDNVQPRGMASEATFIGEVQLMIRHMYPLD